jgi:hypothetical protein
MCPHTTHIECFRSALPCTCFFCYHPQAHAAVADISLPSWWAAGAGSRQHQHQHQHHHHLQQQQQQQQQEQQQQQQQQEQPPVKAAEASLGVWVGEPAVSASLAPLDKSVSG